MVGGEDQTHFLYRFFNAKGALLWVGITARPSGRIDGHRRSDAWWLDVAKITIEHHPGFGPAAIAETLAIETKRPRWNASQSIGHPRQNANTTTAILARKAACRRRRIEAAAALLLAAGWTVTPPAPPQPE